jgi:hypothetical protein
MNGTNMTLDTILPFLGHSEQDPGLADLLASVGFDVSLMPGRAQRGAGTGHCELNSLGIELAFDFHTGYKTRFGMPKDGGKAILSAIFAYGKPNEMRAAYVGPIPFSRSPIHNRDDALREFGLPLRTEEEDGIVEWDQWVKDGVQVRTEYFDDGSLFICTYSVPFIGTASS